MAILMLIIGLMLGFLFAMDVYGFFSVPKRIGVIKFRGKYYVTLIREARHSWKNNIITIESVILDPGKDLNNEMLGCFNLARAKVKIEDYPFQDDTTASLFAGCFYAELDKL